MSECDMSYYKTCRDMAGLTQESAAEALGISVRTLAAYESQERPTPNDVVDSMASEYNTPLLAWWHLKNTCLGKYLPDIQLPASSRDMGFQTVLAHEDVDRAERIIKRAFEETEPIKHDTLRAFRQSVSTASEKLLSAKMFADGMLGETIYKT